MNLKPSIISLCIFVTALGTTIGASATPIFNSATGHYYDTLGAGGKTWTDSEAAATSIAAGAHLVTINDAIEQAWLVSTFGSSSKFWIGFNDAASEGNFVWVSGEMPGYINWSTGEPNNNGGAENYAVMNWGNPGQWNDLSNSYLALAIVEWAPTKVDVPEPGILALFGFGLAGLVFTRRRMQGA